MLYIQIKFQTYVFQVLIEGDIDDDKRLSKSEFNHVISKSPDFMTTFHFGI